MGAAVAFRASSAVALAGGTSLTINKPTGVVDNDVMLLVFYVENTTVVPSVAGSWTLIDNITNGTAWQMYVWYRRAAAEPASYAITWGGTPSVVRSALIVAYSGAITTGSPVDVYSELATAGGTSMIATGVTPVNTDDMLVFLGTWWLTSATVTPPTGMVERYDASDIYAADQLLTSNAPTGDKTATLSQASGSSVYLVALKSAGATCSPVAAASYVAVNAQSGQATVNWS
ncbi:MAG: hypothetical protein AAB154_06230, partial [Candidatus Binatota bacterium]